MNTRAPAIFLGHGSPMNVITENPYRTAWGEIGRSFPKPRAILCVSAHWETSGHFVTASAAPKTIHDFRGFPEALYAVQYPAPGAPDLARHAAELTGAAEDHSWGLDHGAWSVLRFLYPDADVPIVQFSLDRQRTPAEHYALGQKLSTLRDEGVLILGSGNIVHNLRYFFGAERDFDWAVRFNDAVKKKIETGEHQALMDYQSLDREALLAVPTNEHYLPLLYVLAAQQPSERPAILTDSIINSLSMTSVAIGL
jgi:4,5-DOPA dioxygenase extradiol